MPSSLRSPTDSTLLQSALKGDIQALGALIERHFGKAYAVALARLGDPEVAEDLAQEVFLRAQLHLQQLGPRGNFPGWVVRIARNLSIDWLRRGQRASRLLPQVPLEEMASDPPDPSDKGARELMAMDEESRALWKAIESLEPEQREILLLRHMEDLSQREIAEQLGVDPSTVSRRLGAALKKLQRHLEPLLHQAVPRLRARRQAVSKSLVIATAVSALSATAKVSLAAAVPAGEIASATSAAKAGAVGAVGVIGLLQSLPTLIAGGAKAMATGKGIAATITAAAAVTAGGIYLGTSGQSDPGPAPQVTEESEALPGPGAYVLGDDGRRIAMREVDPVAIDSLWERAQAGEDVERLFGELNLPTVPRAREVLIVAPDLEWSWDETIQGGGFRLTDMEAQALESQAEDLGTGSGPWRVTFDRSPAGDALVIGWVHITEGPQRMWLARLEGEDPATSLVPDHEGVFAVGDDGRLIELPQVPLQDMEILMRRLVAGETGVLESMGLPVIPRSARILVLQPRSWYENPNYGPGDGYEVGVITADGGSDAVEARFRDVLSTPGLMEITFPDVLEGEALAVPRGNFSQGEVEVWMGRLP